MWHSRAVGYHAAAVQLNPVISEQCAEQVVSELVKHMQFITFGSSAGIFFDKLTKKRLKQNPHLTLEIISIMLSPCLFR